MDAGFDTVVGIDIETHKNYPGDFILGDVLQSPVNIMDFDFIWASPPCQRFSVSSRFGDNDWQRHPDIIPATRALLEPHPFTCIENVPRAPIRADVVLTGPVVGLPYILRKRHFELSFYMLAPPYQKSLDVHLWREGKAATITKSLSSSSHFYNRKSVGLSGKLKVREARELMGIGERVPMTANEVGEAVPPPYAEIIARAAIALNARG